LEFRRLSSCVLAKRSLQVVLENLLVVRDGFVIFAVREVRMPARLRAHDEGGVFTSRFSSMIAVASFALF